MIAERKHMDGFGVGCMILLCIVLGLHQVAIKAAAPDISPILQIALRFGISAFLVSMVIVSGKERFNLRDGTLLPGIFAGIAFSLEFLCVAEGLRYTTASHMSVFLYTSPIFTSLTLHWFLPAERLRPINGWVSQLLLAALHWRSPVVLSRTASARVCSGATLWAFWVESCGRPRRC